MTNTESTFKQDDKTQALIIGAGMAGLVTARVLADFYEQVLIIERDNFPANREEPRVGTPQAFHVHRLLPRGKLIMEQLFPGYVDDLLAAGGYPILNKPARMVNRSGIFASLQPVQDVSCSRALLESEIRRRVLALPNVRILSNQEVIGLQSSADHTTITGAIVRERGQVDQSSTITAELVIDASGRTSKLEQWLREFGYDLPAHEKVNSQIGYSTRFYKASEQIIEQVGTIVVDEVQEEQTTGVGILPIENDTLWVTLYGIGGHYPPTDVAGYERELANLHLLRSELADQLKQAEPLTDPRGYRVPACIRHHYELAERWPAGLLALGDAFCHFDPIHGQGMTVAAIEASTLAAVLQEQRANPQPEFERRVLQRMQEAIAPAWWLSALNDLRGPTVTYEGDANFQGAPLLHRYLDLYFKYALEHPVEPAEQMSSNQPTIAKFALQNGLLVPPMVIFNAPTLTLLLEAEDASDGPQTLHELVDAYHLSAAEIMEQVIPVFSVVSYGM